MARRLSGWQRLWVVASVIYFIPVCLIAISTFPDGDSLELERAVLAVEAALNAQVDAARASANERAELNALQDLKRGARRVRREAYGDFSDAELIQHIRAKFEGKANFASLEERTQEDAQFLRRERVSFLLKAAAWWVIPVIAAYILGWAIGWVVRGFRSRDEV